MTKLAFDWQNAAIGGGLSGLGTYAFTGDLKKSLLGGLGGGAASGFLFDKNPYLAEIEKNKNESNTLGESLKQKEDERDATNTTFLNTQKSLQERNQDIADLQATLASTQEDAEKNMYEASKLLGYDPTQNTTTLSMWEQNLPLGILPQKNEFSSKQEPMMFPYIPISDPYLEDIFSALKKANPDAAISWSNALQKQYADLYEKDFSIPRSGNRQGYK